jgi:hypothetical protein
MRDAAGGAMRSILLWSAGALLLGASVSGCFRQSEQTPEHARAAVEPAPQGQPTGAVVSHRGDEVIRRGNERGVTEAQPATPAAQPYVPLSVDRGRVSEAVAQASRQIERLTRIEQTADPERRDELDSTIGDLQSRREKVLQDMRELEMRGPASPASMSDTLHSELDRDLNDLQKSLHNSYDVAPPPGQGMPPPAPLPPENLR